MTQGAKTKLQVDGVISIHLPSATNEPQATELTHRVLSLGKRPWFLIVPSSMMLMKRSFGLTRSLFILYVHKRDRLNFGMLSVETAVFDCICWFSSSRNRKSQSYPVEYYLRNRKHVPCFYQVIQTRVEVWENEKYCGHTSHRRVFPQLFSSSPKLSRVFV